MVILHQNVTIYTMFSYFILFVQRTAQTSFRSFLQTRVRQKKKNVCLSTTDRPTFFCRPKIILFKFFFSICAFFLDILRKNLKKKWISKSLASSIQTIAMHDIFPNVAVLCFILFYFNTIHMTDNIYIWQTTNTIANVCLTLVLWSEFTSKVIKKKKKKSDRPTLLFVRGCGQTNIFFFA